MTGLAGALALLAIIALTGRSIIEQHRAVLAAEAQRLASFVQAAESQWYLVAAQFEHPLAHMRDAAIAEGGVLTLDPVRQSALLRRRIELFPAVKSYFVLDRDGGVRALSVRRPGPGDSLGPRAEYLAAHAGGGHGLHLSRPVPGVLPGERLFAATLPITDPAGGFGGVIGVGVDAQYLAGLFGRLGLAPGMHLRLVREDGVVLVGTPETAADEPVPPGLPGRMAQAPEGLWRDASPAGEHLHAYRRGAGGVAVLASAPLEPVLAVWRRRARNMLLLALALAAGIGALTLFALRQSAQRETDQGRLELAHFALEQAGDMILWTDRGMRIRYVNGQGVRRLGYGAEELLGQSHDLINTQATRRYVNALWQEVDAKGQARRETVYRTRSGTVFPVELVATRLQVGGDEFLCQVVRDLSERTRAEREAAAAAEYDRRFRELVPIALLRYEQGRVIDANPAAAMLFGAAGREALLGREAIDLYAPDSRPGVAARMRQLERGNCAVPFVPRRILRDDGQAREVESAALSFDQGGRHHVEALLIDVTEQRHAQQALLQTGERYATLLDLMPVAALLMRDGRIVSANPAAAKLFGAGSPHDLTGRDGLALIAPEDRSAVRERFDSLEKANNMVPFVPRRALRLDGTRIDMEAAALSFTQGGQRWVQVLALDLGERREAERRLRAGEERFAKLFHASPMSMALLSWPDRRYVDVNEAWQRLRGYAPGEVLGRTSEEVGVWVDAEEQRRLLDMLRRDGRARGMPSRVRGRDGRIASTLLSVEPVEIAGVPHMISSAVDVTELTRKDAELRALAESLERRVAQRTGELAQAFGELESFSYSVSHDLRAPLRAIGGFSRLLAEAHAGQLDAEGRRLLGRIEAGAARMSALLDGLLELSRVTRQPLVRGRVDLSRMAREVLADLQALEPQRRVVFRVQPDVVAEGDAALLRSVLINLLGNAWKYTAGRTEARIEFGAEPGPEGVVYFVRDDGAGFDMRYADKLFGAFQRLHTDSEFPGTGIGLATVQRIVGRHGGTARAEAAPGRGATFRFTLGAGD